MVIYLLDKRSTNCVQRVHCSYTWALLLVPSLGLRCAPFGFSSCRYWWLVAVLNGTLLCTLESSLPLITGRTVVVHSVVCASSSLGLVKKPSINRGACAHPSHSCG